MKPGLKKLRRKVISHLKRVMALRRTTLAYASNERTVSDTPPVFIVGCPRSGTTLMRQILDSHPRIACPGETWFLIGLLEQLRNPFFVRGLNGLGVERAEAVGNIRAFALNYYERFLFRSGKKRWADKTPGYVDYCPEICEVFHANVRFVYLLRHGMDVANSMRDRDWVGLLAPGLDASDPLARLEVGARTWIRMTESFERFRQTHPELCHTVRFEELTERPEPIIQGVLRFLGEPWDPAVLRYREFPHSGNGDPKTAARESIAPNSRNYAAWPAEYQRKVHGILADALKQRGYSADVP
jgi:hypothetical protein